MHAPLLNFFEQFFCIYRFLDEGEQTNNYFSKLLSDFVFIFVLFWVKLKPSSTIVDVKTAYNKICE